MSAKTIPVTPQVMEIIVELHVIFDDYDKISAWLKTKNLNLGGCAPIDLINSGRARKVEQFIESHHENINSLPEDL